MLTAAADRAEASAAARHMAGLIARARFEAARRNRVVALRFTTDGAEPTFTLVVDGDGDGVSAADVTSGLDVEIRPPDRLSDHFGGARFGDGRRDAGHRRRRDAHGNWTRRFVSAPPSNSASRRSAPPSSGTLYIASRRGVQYAVRVAGVTGRVRVLRYVPGAARWQAV